MPGTISFLSKRKLNFWCLSSFLFNIFNELVFFLFPLPTQPSIPVGRAEKSVAKIEIFLRLLQIFFRLFFLGYSLEKSTPAFSNVAAKIKSFIPTFQILFKIFSRWLFSSLNPVFSCPEHLAVTVGLHGIKKPSCRLNSPLFITPLNAAPLPESGCKESVFFCLIPNQQATFLTKKIKVPYFQE